MRWLRIGKQVEKDMVTLRIGPNLRMAAVAALAFFERHREPRTPEDLTGHACINLRLPTRSGL